MTNADLDRLENARGIRLPADYRATMLAYPFPPDHEATAFDLPPDIDTILSLQLEPDEAEGPEGPWPPYHVVIGDACPERSGLRGVVAPSIVREWRQRDRPSNG